MYIGIESRNFPGLYATAIGLYNLLKIRRFFDSGPSGCFVAIYDIRDLPPDPVVAHYNGGIPSDLVELLQDHGFVDAIRPASGGGFDLVSELSLIPHLQFSIGEFADANSADRCLVETYELAHDFCEAWLGGGRGSRSSAEALGIDRAGAVSSHETIIVVHGFEPSLGEAFNLVLQREYDLRSRDEARSIARAGAYPDLFERLWLVWAGE